MVKENIVNIDEKELAIAEQEADVSESAYIHSLKKPFEYEGKTYERLIFDWETLTGNDSLAIENEIAALGKPLIAPEFSGEFLIRMAARACTVTIGADTLCSLPMGDYNKIRGKARSFLLKSGQ